MERLRWPWGQSDGNGGFRLLFAMSMFLIPSMFWLEATIFHVNYRFSWSPLLPIGILILVGIGSLMFTLIACAAVLDGIPAAKRMASRIGFGWNSMYYQRRYHME